MIARSAAIDHTFPTIGALSLAQGRFPFGEDGVRLRLAVHRLRRAHARRSERPRLRREVRRGLIPYLVRHSGEASVRRLVLARLARLQRFDRALRSRRPPIRSPVGAAHQRRQLRSLAALAHRLVDRLQRNARPRELRRVSRRPERQAHADRPSQQPLAERSDRAESIPLRAERLRQSVSGALRPLDRRPRPRTPAHLRPASRQPRRAPRRRDRRAADHSRRDASRARVRATARRITADHHRQLRRAVDGAALVASRRLHRRRRAGCAATSRRSSSSIRSARKSEFSQVSAPIQATPSWAYDDSGVYYSSDYTGEAQVYFARLDRSRPIA